MATRTEYNEQVARLLGKLGIEVEFNRIRENPHWGEGSDDKFNFEVTLKKDGAYCTTYFSQGCRVVKGRYKECIADFVARQNEAVRQNEFPDVESFLECLLSDSYALEVSYEE